MANSLYRSDLAFVHRQDAFTVQNVSMGKHLSYTQTNKPTVSIRKIKPKPLIFLLTNKHVLSYNSPFHQDFSQERLVSQAVVSKGLAKS